MSKRIEIIVLICFFAFLIFFSVSFLCVPKQSFSEVENRTLKSIPKVGLETFFSKSFSDSWNGYFSDHFPLRKYLVEQKAVCELLLGKEGNSGILLGKNGQLLQVDFNMRRHDQKATVSTDTVDPKVPEDANRAIRRAFASIRNNDPQIECTFVPVPRKVDVYAGRFGYPNKESSQWYSLLSDSLPTVDLLSVFEKAVNAGESIYYATDHHWTTAGAYLAYREILPLLTPESEAIPSESFRKVTVTNDFHGSVWSAGRMWFVPGDSVEIWTLGDESEYTVTVDGVLSDGFYNLSGLARKDVYGIFLDGTHDVVTVRKNGAERPCLVLFRDSFASSLAPFLARHFDLVLLNLSSVRTDFTDLTKYAKEYNADKVLLIYSAENVLTSNRVEKFR